MGRSRAITFLLSRTYCYINYVRVGVVSTAAMSYVSSHMDIVRQWGIVRFERESGGPGSNIVSTRELGHFWGMFMLCMISRNAIARLSMDPVRLAPPLASEACLNLGFLPIRPRY